MSTLEAHNQTGKGAPPIRRRRGLARGFPKDLEVYQKAVAHATIAVMPKASSTTPRVK